MHAFIATRDTFSFCLYVLPPFAGAFALPPLSIIWFTFTFALDFNHTFLASHLNRSSLPQSPEYSQRLPFLPSSIHYFHFFFSSFSFLPPILSPVKWTSLASPVALTLLFIIYSSLSLVSSFLLFLSLRLSSGQLSGQNDADTFNSHVHSTHLYQYTDTVDEWLLVHHVTFPKLHGWSVPVLFATAMNVLMLPQTRSDNDLRCCINHSTHVLLTLHSW